MACFPIQNVSKGHVQSESVRASIARVEKARKAVQSATKLFKAPPSCKMFDLPDAEELGLHPGPKGSAFDAFLKRKR